MLGIIGRTDSYKPSHWPGYPEGTDSVFAYMESRGGEFTETVQAGTTGLLLRYLTEPVTRQNVQDAYEFFADHFGDPTIFNYDGWMRVANEFGGALPLRIRAVPEGMVVPTRNILMSVENTAKGFGWLGNYTESLLLKLWYPITVATLSREIKKVIKAALEKTGTVEALPYKLHDFGYRGVSSEESAEIGGFAHLVNFKGSDTIPAILYARQYYGERMAANSIPASEHSVMTAKGEMGEVEQMKWFISAFKKAKVPAIAVVSDSYNIFRAIKDYYGGALRGQIEDFTENGRAFVVRPDSGDPVTMVRQVIETLDEVFGHTRNDKGYKILNNNVRVIQGDGINLPTIIRILDELIVRGWSADNIAFGMGGALLQQVNRDTQQFAFKASSITINGRESDVYKDPITSSSKRSKRGRLKLIRDDYGVLTTVRTTEIGHDLLETVFENGEVLARPTLAQIRALAEV